MQAIAILRTSTNKQETGLQAQRDAIAIYAHLHSISIVDWHTEAVSGSTPLELRPTLLKAISGLRPGMCLLASKWDRITRDTRVASDIQLLVTKRQAIILVADGAGNGDDMASEAMRGMLLVFAKLERRMIGARIKAALAVKRAQGVRLGRPPGAPNKAPRRDIGVKRGPNVRSLNA